MAGLDDLFSDIKAIAQEAKDRTRQEAQRVVQMRQFARGYQWQQFGTFPFVIDQQTHPDAERPRLNLVRRLLRAFASMVVGSLGGFSVAARNGTSLARFQARQTEAVVRSLWRDDGYFPMHERADAVFLAASEGAAWLKVCWDPNKIRKYGGQVEGDIDIQVKPRTQVHPDPAADRECDIGYVFETESIPFGTAITRYPTDASGRPTGASSFERETVDEFDHRDWVTDREDTTSSYRRTHETRNYRVTITKGWFRPGRHFPKGLFIAFSGETILSISPLPYEWPWVLLPGPNSVPGRLYPDGLLADLEGPQRDALEVSGRQLEWIKACSAPTLLVHRNARVGRGDFSDLAGDVVQWDGNNRPEWMNPPAPPAQLFETVENRFELMKTIAAISEINLGSTPTDDFSGRAVAILEDLQRSSHGDSFSSWYTCCSRVVQLMLKIAHVYWPDEKVLLLPPTHGQGRTVVFRREEFDSDSLVVVMPNAKPKSQTAARSETLELFGAGVYGDTPDAARVRADLQIAGPEVAGLDEIHKDKALRENVYLFQGGHRPEVDPLDDHEIHFREHQVALFTENADPQLRRMLADHIMQHTQFLMGAMAQSQPAPEGAPPEEGGGVESPMNGGIGDLEGVSATGDSPGPTE